MLLDREGAMKREVGLRLVGEAVGEGRSATSSSSSSSSSSTSIPKHSAPLPPCKAMALAAFPQEALLLASEVTGALWKDMGSSSLSFNCLSSSSPLGVRPSKADKALSLSLSFDSSLTCGDLGLAG